jgi:hypothetical protein
MDFMTSIEHHHMKFEYDNYRTLAPTIVPMSKTDEDSKKFLYKMIVSRDV